MCEQYSLLPVLSIPLPPYFSLNGLQLILQLISKADPSVTHREISHKNHSHQSQVFRRH